MPLFPRFCENCPSLIARVGSATVMGRKSQYVTKSFIHVTRLVLPSWDITVASTSGISLQM